MPTNAGGATTDLDSRPPTTSSTLERVTVNLAARASRALNEVVTLTGDSKTDAINRALAVYAYIEQIIHDGGSVYVQGKDDTAPEKLKIF
jgi:hypothetical protein